MIPAMLFRAEDGKLVPLSATAFAKHFTDGQRYRMAEAQPASSRSRGYYFACLDEAWRNLPEPLAERFNSVEALRKHALIATGWCDVVHAVYESEQQATEAAHNMTLFARRLDPIGSTVVKKGLAVMLLTAKSQADRAMGHKDFQASKSDVLDHVAQMIGVTQEQLKLEAGRAA